MDIDLAVAFVSASVLVASLVLAVLRRALP